MKKMTKIVAGVIAAASLFSAVSCTNGDVQPEIKYVDNVVDLEGKQSETIDYSGSYYLLGSELLGIDKAKAKITMEVALDNYWGQGRFLLKDEWWLHQSEVLFKDGMTDGEGVAIAYESADPYFKLGTKKADEIITITIKPTADEAKKIATDGITIQGERIIIKSVTVSYEGEELINPNVKKIAKAKGTFGGDGEVVADVSTYDQQQVMALVAKGDAEKEQTLSYAFEKAVSAKNYKNVTFEVRAFDSFKSGKPVEAKEALKVNIDAEKGDYQLKGGKLYKVEERDEKTKEVKKVAEKATTMKELDPNFRFYCEDDDSVKFDDDAYAYAEKDQDNKETGKAIVQVKTTVAGVSNWSENYKPAVSHGMVVEVKGTHAYKDEKGKDATKAAVSSCVVPYESDISKAYTNMTVPFADMFALDGATTLDFGAESKDTIESINIKFGNSTGTLYLTSILFE